MSAIAPGAVAVVTGGGAGIGAALVRALARAGAGAVAVADVDGAAARGVAESVRGAGCDAHAHGVDVADAEAVAALVDATVARHGRIDYLFNNAGLGLWGDARDVTDEQWRRVIDVNLWGAINGTRAAYPIMCAQGAGHIVNVASLAGLVPGPGVVAYATAKHGVVGLSLSLRAEAADLGVRVSVACPGPVRSGFHAAALATPRQIRGPREPARAPDADGAAARILAGVARDRAVIVLPAHARAAWLAYRAWPALLARSARRVVAGVRAARR